MTTKREKTKSKPKEAPKADAHFKPGSPFAHVYTPAHRIPGQPVGINYTQKRDIFDPEFHPLDFVKHCQEGATQWEIAAAWGVSITTLKRWAKDKPEFAQVYSIGATAQKAWVAKKMRGAIDDKSKSFVPLIFTAKNMLGWSDDPGSDFDDDNEMEVDIEVELDEE